MASGNRVVAVDLGTSTVKVGEFGIARNGALTLLKFGVADLGLDPNKEEERGKFITPTLAKLLKDLRIKGREIRLSISGQSVFMRFVKLPPVDASQVGQIVEFEARQNVPFPIDEVTWDYQMMPTRGASSEAEAVIVAIKKEVIEAEVAAVENAGVKIKQVDVAPFALLNAFRYSELQTDECALIIDMGARSTNLIFVEKNSFWVRNVPIAGNQISQAICNDMQEPFIAAETLKKGKGFVSLGGVYADPDDADAARISKLIRTSMTKLHVDINRSIAYYRNTMGGGAPKRAFLTGGSTQLPYLDLFIADKLSVPVVYFNPLRNVNLDPSLNSAYQQANNCYTGEITGLALRETGSAPAEVSLEAPTLASRFSKTRKQPFYLTAMVAYAALFICLGLYYYSQKAVADAKAAELGSNATSLGGVAPKITKLAGEQASLATTLAALQQLGDQRDAWAQILSTINDKLPPGVWITELVPAASPESVAALQQQQQQQQNRPGQPAAFHPAGNVAQGAPIDLLLISGLYHANGMTMTVDPGRLRDFVNALADTPFFDIDKTNQAGTLTNVATVESAPNNFAQTFKMHLKLKTPIPLKPETATDTKPPGK